MSCPREHRVNAGKWTGASGINEAVRNDRRAEELESRRVAVGIDQDLIGLRCQAKMDVCDHGPASHFDQPFVPPSQACAATAGE